MSSSVVVEVGGEYAGLINRKIQRHSGTGYVDNADDFGNGSGGIMGRGHGADQLGHRADEPTYGCGTGCFLSA